MTLRHYVFWQRSEFWKRLTRSWRFFSNYWLSKTGRE